MKVRLWPGADTLRGKLVVLVLAVIVPALAAGAVLLWSAYHQGRMSIQNQLGDQARALGLVVDRQIGQEVLLVQALSATREFQQGDWQAFARTARAAVVGDRAWVVVVEPDGRQLVNTKARVGSPLPTSNEADLGLTWGGDQPDGSRISNLFRSKVTGQPVVIASRPFRIADGRMVHLAVTTDARVFDTIWKEQGIPDTWVGAVVDSRGVIVTRSRGADKYVGRSASPTTVKRLAESMQGVAETTTLDGVRSITAWSRSPRYHWSFVLAAPRAEIMGAAHKSLVVAALVGLSLMAAGVALALWVAQRIAHPVKALTTAARQWEAGQEPVWKRSGVAELDVLGAAFAEAAGRLVAKQSELQALNASLEARVAERSRELEATTESLVQSQKLEAIGRLTGGVAHDFNNLLMAVSGNLDLLKRRLTDERLLRYVSQARQAAERGAKLTGQLLAFSRKQRLQPRAVDINNAIAEARDLLTGALGGVVSVETVLAPGLWPAMTDPTQLELVILNLVINARDASPAGGVVVIETSNVVRSAASGRPESPPAGEFVMMAVRDRGTGMSAEVAARVFEPFFTTKQIGQGSGLGLPQVLGLAKQLGGGVEIDTQPGAGATVMVFLPRAADTAVAVDAPSEEEAADLKGLRILLVDDDADVRLVTLAMLTELGCAVTDAASGPAGVAQAALGGPFDAALIDFAMPGMNGAEAATRILEAIPELTVVMMSGYPDVDALNDRWSGPLLHKPFSAAALAAQIARATRFEDRRVAAKT